MISTQMQDAINAQIQEELASAHLYLAMSAYCAGLNFAGFAHWLRLQHDEERSHALKLMDHLLERGGQVKLTALEAPGNDFGGILDVFTKVAAHERHISECIDRLFGLARETKDFATEVFLAWYVSEQVEEEAHVSEILEKIKAMGDKGGAIWYLDKEMGKRN